MSSRDVEQKARDVAEECFEQCIGWMKSGYPGGMADPPNLTELIAKALRDVREADAQVIDVAVQKLHEAKSMMRPSAYGNISQIQRQIDDLESYAAAIRSQGVK